jgi:glycerate kinase
LLDAVRFDDLLQGATLVITGEGSADRQMLLDAGFASATCINPADLPLEEAMKPEVASEALRRSAMRCWRASGGRL